MAAAKKTTPVTLVTGYLGAGKTTLVNSLLAALKPGEKAAVIVNEFGAVGIDGELLVEQAGRERVVELANGCICCVVTGEFRTALESMIARGFARVIIETSGAADPTSVQRTLWGSVELSKVCRLDAVVCVADAEHFAKTVEADPVALVQASVADAILLTKAARAGAARVADARTLIAKLNSSALVLEHDFQSGEPFDFAKLLSLDAYRKPMPAFTRATSSTSGHSGLSSVSETWTGQVQRNELQAFFRGLVTENKTLRLKAILHVEGESRPWLVQGVQTWIEKTMAPKTYDGPNRLVVLGREMDADRLKNSINRLKFSK